MAKQQRLVPQAINLTCKHPHIRQKVKKLCRRIYRGQNGRLAWVAAVSDKASKAEFHK